MDPVTAARQGREDAFLQLFEEHRLPLFRFAYRMTGSVADAEDIVQECFLELLRPECSYRPAVTPIRTYLFGVVRNQALKRLAKRTGRAQGERPTTPDASPESRVLRIELEEVVARAVTDLPEGLREVLILAHYEQLAIAEIARVTRNRDHRRQIAPAAGARPVERDARSLRDQHGEEAMNDNELDEMLDQWKPPLMRDSLREDLRAGFAARPQSPGRSGWLRRIRDAAPAFPLRRLAVVTMAAVALLFMIVQALPQVVRMASSGFRIPYYVEFEFARYADNGAAPYPTRITSFPYGGHEIVMSVTEPGHLLAGAARNIASSIRKRFILAMPSLVLPKQPPVSEPAWFAGFVSSGCSSGKNVVGRETIAGYPAAVVQSTSPGHRITVWMAPELDCFALKFTDEVQEPDGTFRLKLRKQAVQVTVNP